MASLDQIRQRYPSARDLSDNELITKLSELTETPYEQVASRFGFDQKTSRGVFGAANDYAIEAANAAAGLAKGVTDFVSPGNAAGQFIQENIIERGEANQSVPVTLAKRQLQRGLQSDEIMPQLGAVASYVGQNPLLAASQAVGSFGPIGGAMKGAQVVSGLAGLGARGAARVGLGTSAALSGAAAGGDAGSAAYELVMNTPWDTVSRHPQAQALIDAGANPDQVYEELATRAARNASVVPAIIGAVSGATGAESALASGVKGLKGVAKKVGVETLSETLEEGTTQYAGQRAAQEYNPEINPMRGVVGAGALGGALGAMVATPISIASMEKDLTARETPTEEPRVGTQKALGLTYNPDAGKYITYPDGSIRMASDPMIVSPTGDVMLNKEQEFQSRTGTYPRAEGEVDLAAPTKVVEPTTVAAANAVAASASVVSPERAAQKAFRDTYGIPQTPANAQIVADIESEGFTWDSPEMVDLRNFVSQQNVLSKRTLAKARQMLDATVIESRKGPTNVSPTTAPVSATPTGVGAGSPLVQGSVATTGPSAGIAIQPGTGARVVGTPTGQVQPVSTTGGQQAAPVTQGPTNGAQAPQAKQTKAQGQTTTTRGAAGTTPLVDTSDDALEIARATGNAGAIEAMREDEAGLRADATTLTDEDVGKVVGARFAKSKNAKRDTEILNAYLTALRTNAGTDKAAIQNAIGDKYGITAVAVRKIGNPSKLVEAGAELGFSAEQVLDLFNVDDNTKAQFTAVGKLESEIRDLRKAYKTAVDADKRNEVANRMAALSEQITKIKEKASAEKAAAFSAGLQEAGVSSVEGESAGFGFDTEREWSRVEGESKVASTVLELSNQIESLQESAAKLDEQGQSEAADAARAAIAARQAKIDAVLTAVQTETKPVATKAPDVAEARQRWNDAGRDLTKLSVEDLQVLKGYTASINNKALSDKIAAEISSRGVTPEPTNAVQVQSPASVSVQPKAKAGQGVGAKVRSAEKPASKGEAKILTSQEQYEKVTAGFPAPAWADLTPAQQSKMTDLASRDQLNLAAVNRFIAAETAVDTEVNKILRLERGDTVDVTAGSLKFEGSITDEGSLRRFPGVDNALSHYENNDLRHVIDAVELWMVAPDTVDFDAAILMVDGKQTLAVRSGMLVDSDKADWSIHHELGHIADDAFRTGGIYSGAPELNLTIQKGVVKPMGAVASEVIDYAAQNPDSAFAQTMGYPIDRTRDSTKNLTSDETRMEMFAQLWAIYNRRGGKDFLADNLPLTFDFMEINDEAAKQDRSIAGAQASTAATPTPSQPQTDRGAQGVTPAVLRSARPSEGVIAKNISKLPKAAQQPVRNMLGAIGDVTGKGLDYLVFTSDLVNRATKEGISSAKKFVDLIGQSKAEARANEIAVEKIADMYALVPEKDRGTGEGSVNRFLFDSTRESKWGYGQYRDPEMGRRFDALSKESQAFVEAVFAHGTTVLAQKKKIVVDSTNSEYDAMIAMARASGDKAAESKLLNEKKATIKRFQTLFKIRDGMPYAPIKRNGSHVVIAKSAEYEAAEAAKDAKLIEKLEADSDHYHVSFTDGKWEGRTLQQELIDQGAFASVELAERDSAVDEMFSGHSALRELTAMRSRVDEQAKDGDRSASKMLSLISQMYLEALAEGSARKSEMRRRGVAGEVDMIRSFAQQGRADANFMASVKYNPQVQDALQEMRTQSKGGNRERKSEVFNELAKRYTQSMEYSPRPWLNKLTRMSSIYYLATSPAYYLQNLTQPWMMSVPAMAGQHDYTAASSALFKAYTELGGVMKSAKLLKQQFDFDKVPADVREAIKELVNRGKIDIGLDTEIGEFKVEGDGYFAGKISAADKALRLAVQKVESINRLSTAMAAYRLELARTNGDKAAATNYADRILTETHGDYTSFNAPRAFNTGVGKVALQFRKFQLIQLSFYAKLIKDALQGNDRKAALATLGYSLAHTGVLAGAMGLPGYAAIAWAIGALLGDDDEPYDVTSEIRKAIGDEAVANLVLRGAPTIAGMDISGKVGAGNMLSIMPFSQADLSTTAGRAEALGTLVGGASLGMTSRMVDGLGLMLSGDWYRGIEQTMPKGVSDAMKAYRISQEGLTRRNGDVVLPASEVSAMDSLFQAIGISPVQQTVTYERQNAVKALTQNFQERTTELKNQYTKADRQNDNTAKAELRAEWNKLQEAKARNGVPRAPLSNLLKAPMEQRKRERETVGGIPYNKATRNLAKQYSEI